MKFSKSELLNIEKDVCEKFKYLKEEFKIYFTASETTKDLRAARIKIFLARKCYRNIMLSV